MKLALLLQSMEYQLQQSQKLSEMYREQVIQLEDELSRIREEGDVTRDIFKVSQTHLGRLRDEKLRIFSKSSPSDFSVCRFMWVILCVPCPPVGKGQLFGVFCMSFGCTAE